MNMLVVVVMAGSGTLWAAGGVLPGGGTEGDPYLIEDLANFYRFAGDPNYWGSGVYTRLGCDPNLADRPYTTAVIAPDTPDTDYLFNGVPFEGIFDGDGHVISNLTINTAGAGNNGYLGLFGKIIGSSAEVKNLRIENINITGGDHSHKFGGLCGANGNYEYSGGTGGTITSCYSGGSVTGGISSYRLGGLCGSNSGTITRCYATASVTGGQESGEFGGLCGRNWLGTVTECYSGGSVTGGDESGGLGGLCGSNNSSDIINCYATGLVTGGDYSGGLGGLCGENMGLITNCYATGPVTGGDNSHHLGGLNGVNVMGPIINCFWDIETSGMTWSDRGTGLRTAQMQTLSTFVDAGWDLINVWNIGENQTYPYIRTYSASDINKDRITNFGDLCIVAGEWMNEE